jgi:VanZ family protein
VSGGWFQGPGIRNQKRDPNILNKLRKFSIYWLPIFVYCLLIFIQSSYPSPEIEPDLPYFDKVLHFTAYALLAALFLRAFYTTRIKHNLKLIIILSILLSSLYGISDEIHQSYVPFRTADAMDALADILGSTLGVYIFFKIKIGDNAKTTKPGF